MTDQPAASLVVEPRDVALRMRMEYSHGLMDHSMRTIEEVTSLCSKSKRPGLEVDAFLKEAVEMVSRHFGVSSASIALWDPKKSVFRYRAFAGIEKETEDAYAKLIYTKEQVFNEKTYPSHEISKYTRIYLSEERPYSEGEVDSFSRPSLLGMKRRSLTDSLEGDYLCCYFSDSNGEVIGWIESSGTRLRKLPDSATIKWIELVACIVGAVVSLKS